MAGNDITGDDRTVRFSSSAANPRVVGGGGGEYLVWKRIPTAVQPLRSSGHRDTRLLKKKKGGGGLSSYYIILYYKGAVRVFACNILHHVVIVYMQICS